MFAVRTMVTAAESENLVEMEQSVIPKKPRVTIPGRATPAGTEKFIIDSGIKLFHKFEISKLFVNPIIHGPPRLIPIRFRKPINQKASDNQLLTAVHRNWSNMVYVYNHYSNIHVAGYWNTTVLRHIMLKKNIKGVPNPHYRPRESLVTVAGLGLVADYDEIARRLEQARQTTRLETIDFAIVEVQNHNQFQFQFQFQNQNQGQAATATAYATNSKVHINDMDLLLQRHTHFPEQLISCTASKQISLM